MDLHDALDAVGGGPGNYRFRNRRGKTTYTGRSDVDLKAEVLRRIRSEKSEGASSVEFESARDPVEAYYRECADFHELAPRLNFRHPGRPRAGVACPICGCCE